MSDKTKITGILEKANTNDRGFSSVLVNGTWYSTYKTNYSELEGQEVWFMATSKESNGKTYWNAGDVKATGNKPKPAAPAARGGSGFNDSRQSSIVLQSSYKTAAELLGRLVAADKIDLGKSKATSMEIALGILDSTAMHIYVNCIDTTDFIEGMMGIPSEEADDDDEYSPTQA